MNVCFMKKLWAGNIYFLTYYKKLLNAHFNNSYKINSKYAIGLTKLGKGIRNRYIRKGYVMAVNSLLNLNVLL